MTRGYHEPVLVAEIQELLVRMPGLYVDGTLGGGGHSLAILKELQRKGYGASSLLIGIDQDECALTAAREKLNPFGEGVVEVKGNFSQIAEIVGRVCGQRSIEASAVGILLDLGVSSAQIDTPERGFSYSHHGPLDMRMDSGSSTSAADVVNAMSQRELASLFFRYGEEPRSRSIARDILDYREKHGPLSRTEELAGIIRKGERRPDRAIKTLSRVFQALRIEVNHELEVLRLALNEAVSLLCPEGRLAVISYHSLEDRMVKAFFADKSRSDWGPKGVGLREPLVKAGYRVVTRKAVSAGEREVSLNPRARSARLRVLEKLDEGE
ncbi:MAG: 16S rRNA (cytosine(1402)-N(4))-methyltransferase RsmH [Chlorobium sp.]|uniref:16S rRNA (cytosine(1402)-N(4))-methyltransferase RsmH n=1 Tax=Chlorobium sp. TaxID=1095 RepID=UPI0025B899E6|nr:16S rRNA (cytosine(1402)-N(4))-methyltransferase RsmH [Chlorobium sp.]MCF8382205.1 16S rRNA (cytosine(1402)-N(4))-methyltransferase RsmH [Chlorobium sp.]